MGNKFHEALKRQVDLIKNAVDDNLSVRVDYLSEAYSALSLSALTRRVYPSSYDAMVSSLLKRMEAQR